MSAAPVQMLKYRKKNYNDFDIFRIIDDFLDPLTVNLDLVCDLAIQWIKTE